MARYLTLVINSTTLRGIGITAADDQKDSFINKKESLLISATFAFIGFAFLEISTAGENWFLNMSAVWNSN